MGEVIGMMLLGYAIPLLLFYVFEFERRRHHREVERLLAAIRDAVKSEKHGGEKFKA
jgi:hypothetical protein